MTFPPRGHRRWRLSMRTPHPQRTTRWRPPTPTTAATGTTPNPTMTPTPTHATMGTRARPSPPLPMAHMDTDRPRTQDMATMRWLQRQAQPRCPATRSPRRRRQQRSPMAATRSRHLRLWWSLQTLPPPLPPWCAATALWASNRWWRPHTASTRTPTRWARPHWSGWGPCPSWCQPRAEQARWSEVWLDFETKWVFGCDVWNPLMKNRRNMGWSSPLPFTTVSFCMSRPLYLKTNWDFTVQSSIDANSLMDRNGQALQADHPLIGWISPAGVVGSFFPTIWVIFTMLEWNFPQNLDSQVFFSGLDHCDDCVLSFSDSKQHEAFSSQCVHTAWSDRSELGIPHKCMCPLF